MSYAIAAEAQVVLEGVPLPAEKERLVEYAQKQDASARVLAAVRSLSGRVYRTIDEVGEELAPVQPVRARTQPHEPREETGAPPGGDHYRRAH
jgi:Mg-chelatase subunit ChlI